MSSDFEVITSCPTAERNHIGHHHEPTVQQWTSAVLLEQSTALIGRSPKRNCCSRCWTSSCSWLTSALGVTTLLVLYLMLGATMFMLLGNHAAFRIKRPSPTTTDPMLGYDPDGQLLEKTTATVDRLWAITEDLNILYRDNWTHLARNEMRHYQAEIVHTLRRMMLEERYSFRLSWTFPMSLLYALTLITTIGYSYYTPATVLARSLTTAYSIIGIPLFLLYLSVVGERLAKVIARLTCSCCCCCSCCFRRRTTTSIGLRSAYHQYSDVTLTLQPVRNGHVAQLETTSENMNEDHHHDPKRPDGRSSSSCCANQVPLLVCAGLLSVFIGTGSLLLSLVEPELGFFDSLHLIVNLILTLGFAGNVLPGMSAEGRTTTNGHQGSLVLLTCIILLGMTLLSSSFNVILEASRTSSSSSSGTSAGKAASTYQHMPSPSRQIA